VNRGVRHRALLHSDEKWFPTSVDHNRRREALAELEDDHLSHRLNVFPAAPEQRAERAFSSSALRIGEADADPIVSSTPDTPPGGCSALSIEH
jgi:hypothetical protein